MPNCERLETFWRMFVILCRLSILWHVWLMCIKNILPIILLNYFWIDMLVDYNSSPSFFNVIKLKEFNLSFDTKQLLCDPVFLIYDYLLLMIVRTYKTYIFNLTLHFCCKTTFIISSSQARHKATWMQGITECYGIWEKNYYKKTKDKKE